MLTRLVPQVGSEDDTVTVATSLASPISIASIATAASEDLNGIPDNEDAVSETTLVSVRGAASRPWRRGLTHSRCPTGRWRLVERGL